jgi:hypothetical protein
MKTYRRVRGIVLLFLTSAIDGDWVGATAGLDTAEQRKVSCSYRESNPSRPARRYTDGVIPVPESCEVN